MKSIRLAPMAGITDWPFRRLCFQRGCDIAYTEMISAMGYIMAPDTSRAFGQLMAVAPDEGPVIAQIFGKEADWMQRAAAKLEQTGRYAGIDINMGCPARKVASSGEGSGLMRTPENAGEIMRAVAGAVSLPVTVKFRLGWDDDSINVVNMAKLAEDCGIAAVAVHGRTRMQQYSGKADWAQIARVKQAVRIPVFGNGDVFTPWDGAALLEQTGCDGILIGRGAMGNPWLFGQIKEVLAGREPTMPTTQQRVDAALEHARTLASWKPAGIAVREMRKHVAWYISGVRGAARLRQTVNQAKGLAELEAALMAFAASAEEETEQDGPERPQI